jgi:hypothetical protein
VQRRKTLVTVTGNSNAASFNLPLKLDEALPDIIRWPETKQREKTLGGILSCFDLSHDEVSAKRRSEKGEKSETTQKSW